MTAIRLALITPVILVFSLLLPSLSAGAAPAAEITQQQLLQRLDAGTAPLLLDVRRPDEFASGHVPKAINIPHTEIAKRLDELRPNLNNEVIVYCESGRRAAIASDILKQAGFTQVIHLKGDMKAWRQHGLPTEGASPQTKP